MSDGPSRVGAGHFQLKQSAAGKNNVTHPRAAAVVVLSEEQRLHGFFHRLVSDKPVAFSALVNELGQWVVLHVQKSVSRYTEAMEIPTVDDVLPTLVQICHVSSCVAAGS